MTLASEGCSRQLTSQLRPLVALELAPRALLASDDDRDANATTRASLECLDGKARLRVFDTRRAEAVQLEMRLDAIAAPARPRAIALALAELIATSRLQRRGQSTRAAAVSVDVGVAEARNWQMWLAAGASYGAEPAMLVPAADLGIGYVSQWLSLRAAGRAQYARASVGSAGVELLSLSVALSPGFRARAQRLSLHLGPGLRLGYASMRGIAASDEVRESTLSGLWLGPCLQAALALDVTSGWALMLSAEAGYVMRGLTGLDESAQTLLELAGVWMALQIGVRFDL